MKLLVDAVGSGYGGIKTYVRHLLQAWQQAFPEDELHVLHRAGDDLGLNGVVLHPLRVPRPSMATRPVLQSREIRRQARRIGADVVLATIPATTLVHPGPPLVVVEHDLRHELRPEQFARVTRTTKALAYARTRRIADGFVAISQRTLGDLQRLHPRLQGVPSAVVHHGADHASTWPDTASDPYAVAFGHHTNKHPELVIRAWTAVPDLRLVILGVPDMWRADLQAVIDGAGVGDRVELASYLPDAEFERVSASASLVVMASSFEGFGLPVLEAMWHGIPVVMSPDPALLEVAGGHGAVMSGWTSEAVVEAVAVARRSTAEDLAAAAAHARTFTWARSAHETRRFLEDLIGGA